ncbi:MAG TPA: hypothetical protein VGN42_20060 [Pirellulales bacterium]|nr:hypothetical protein [Pirellulales bacterium]
MNIARWSFILLTAISGRAAAEEANITLDELRAALRFQLTSLRSISAKYAISFEPNGTDHTLRTWGPDAHEWAEQDDRRLIRRTFPRGSTRPNSMYSFDGALAYDYVWPTDPAARGGLKISKTLNPGYSSVFTPSRLIGRSIIVVDCDVLDIVGDPSAVLDGRERIGEEECWRIDLDGVDTGTSVPAHVSVFLDPRHDYLPKRISVDRMIGGKNIQLSCETDEFSRVRDNAANDERWFPTRAAFYQAGGRHIMGLSEVIINDFMSDEHFRPDVPDGTRIYDWTGGDEVASIAGGRRALDSIVDESAELAKQQVEKRKGELAQKRKAGAAALDASVSPGWPVSRMAAYACVVAIVMGLAAWVKRAFPRRFRSE